MIKKIGTIVIFIFFTNVSCFGQLDTVALNETAKLLIVAEKGIKTYDRWQTDLAKHVVVKKLHSAGFSKTIFLLMEYRIDNLDQMPDSLYKKMK